MPEFKPLKFHHYNWSLPENEPEKVISPPYDVLSASDIKSLGRNINNIVHIDSPASYEAAAKILEKWISGSVLSRDPVPMFYIMSTSYRFKNQEKLRWGVFGGMKVHPFSEGRVYPHEMTYPKAKDDRLKLMLATRAQLSPIFGIYDDPGLTLENLGRELASVPPLIHFAQEAGVLNRVWQVPEAWNAVIQELMDPRQVFIADGHHRYETALNYKEIMPASAEAPWNHIFTYLSNISSPGLEIFPYHRILSWHQAFDWNKILQQAASSFQILDITGHDQSDELTRPDSILLITQKARLLLVPENKPEQLFDHIGAHVFDRLLLRRIMGLDEAQLSAGSLLSYTHDQNLVQEKVAHGEAQAGFILNPVPMDVLRRVSRSGEVMPRKSTYFYPKLPTGVLLHVWDHDHPAG
ncbi:MAG: DUF1015 family protein [Desulfonatronovibrionaceae bacterium]